MSVARKADRRSGEWVGLVWENPVGIQPVAFPPAALLVLEGPLGHIWLIGDISGQLHGRQPWLQVVPEPLRPCSDTAGWLSFWGTWLTVPVLSPPAGIPVQRVLPGLQIPIL